MEHGPAAPRRATPLIKLFVARSRSERGQNSVVARYPLPLPCLVAGADLGSIDFGRDTSARDLPAELRGGEVGKKAYVSPSPRRSFSLFFSVPFSREEPEGRDAQRGGRVLINGWHCA